MAPMKSVFDVQGKSQQFLRRDVGRTCFQRSVPSSLVNSLVCVRLTTCSSPPSVSNCFVFATWGIVLVFTSHLNLCERVKERNEWEVVIVKDYSLCGLILLNWSAWLTCPWWLDSVLDGFGEMAVRNGPDSVCNLVKLCEELVIQSGSVGSLSSRKEDFLYWVWSCEYFFWPRKSCWSFLSCCDCFIQLLRQDVKHDTVFQILI